MNEKFSYLLLKPIEKVPGISQRELAIQKVISLGRVNYCIKALIDKGWVKASNFKNSQNKIACAYVLTSKGKSEKAKTTPWLQNKPNTIYGYRCQTRSFCYVDDMVEAFYPDHGITDGI